MSGTGEKTYVEQATDAVKNAAGYVQETVRTFVCRASTGIGTALPPHSRLCASGEQQLQSCVRVPLGHDLRVHCKRVFPGLLPRSYPVFEHCCRQLVIQCVGGQQTLLPDGSGHTPRVGVLCWGNRRSACVGCIGSCTLDQRRSQASMIIAINASNVNHTSVYIHGRLPCPPTRGQP